MESVKIKKLLEAYFEGTTTLAEEKLLRDYFNMLVVAFGVGGFYLSQPNYSKEEKEALAAFEKSKQAMMLLSENLNKGTEQLTVVGQFGKTKNKIFE